MKTVIIQTVVPDYRIGLFSGLRKEMGDNLLILCGRKDFGTLVTADSAVSLVDKVANHYLFGKTLLWQSLPWRTVVSADIVIVNGNVRNISTTILSLIRKLTKKRTINWNHLKGRNWWVSSLRAFHLRLFDCMICYTQEELKAAKQRYPWLKVYAAPNACMNKRDCCPEALESTAVKDVVYVGRLVENKKPVFLLRAFKKALEGNIVPNNTKLCFVGAGPEETKLREIIYRDYSLKDRVDFAGHVSDVQTLKSIYGKSLIAVSPGYVGLSCIQAFAFGVPMVISKTEPHSPEIEACVEGFNSYFYETDNIDSFCKTIDQAYKERDKIVRNRMVLAEWTAEHYSFENMIKQFLSVINQTWSK